MRGVEVEVEQSGGEQAECIGSEVWDRMLAHSSGGESTFCTAHSAQCIAQLGDTGRDLQPAHEIEKGRKDTMRDSVPKSRRLTIKACDDVPKLGA